MSLDKFFIGEASAATAAPKFANPLAAKPPQFAAKAKSVIFLFMYGGPSQVDTFDYKPKLYPLDGQTVPVKTFGRGGKKNEGRVAPSGSSSNTATVENGRNLPTSRPGGRYRLPSFNGGFPCTARPCCK